MNLDDKLESIFLNINEWLKFAEAKNVGLIALNGALTVGLIQSIEQIKGFEPLLSYYCLLVACSSVLSAIVGMMSLFARLSPPWWLALVMKEKKSAKDNCMFFGDISKYSTNQYFERIALQYKDMKINSPEYCKDLCAQITSNSKISVIKYKQFNIALFCLMGGILTPIGLYAYNYVKK